MALPTVIAENQTGSPIDLSDLDLTVPASGSITLTDYVKFFECAASISLATEVENDTILINDGTSTLSKAESLGYLDSSGNMNGPPSGGLLGSLVKLDDSTGRYTASTGVTIDSSDNLTTTGNINAAAIEIGGSPLVINDLDDVDTATQAPTANDGFRWNGSDWVPTKNNYTTTAPTVNDDDTQGYAVGSRWIDINTGYTYVCTDNSTGAAFWLKTPQVINDLTDVDTTTQAPTDNDLFLWSGSEWVPLKNNQTTVDPTVNNDVDEGYVVGSRWVNTSTDNEFLCLDNTDGAAVWLLTTSTGGAAMLGSVWEFDSNTTASDPGSGKFRLNNATQSSATAMYVSQTSGNGVDYAGVFGAMRSGDRLYVQDEEDSSRFHILTLTGTGTDNGAWWTFPLTVEDSGSDLVNAKDDGFIFHWTSGATTTDEKVRVSSNDTTSGFLNGKLITTTTGVSFTIVNPSGDEDYRLDINTASTGGQGLIELADQTEVNTGTDTTRAVVPSTLANATTVVHPSDSINILSDVDTATQAPTNEDNFRWDGSDWVPLKNNHTTTDPTVNDDSGSGYVVGSTWINTTDDTAFLCVDNSSGAAVWVRVDAEGAEPDTTIVEASTVTNTNATSAVLINSMTITPGAGTYLVTFSATVYASRFGTEIVGAIYTGGTLETNTEREVQVVAANYEAILSTQARVTVGASDAIEARWYVGNSGTRTIYATDRSLIIERVS